MAVSMKATWGLKAAARLHTRLQQRPHRSWACPGLAGCCSHVGEENWVRRQVFPAWRNLAPR